MAERPPTSGRGQPLAVKSTGRPVALFGFARLLLQLRAQPSTLHLVHTADEPRRPVSAQLERQV